MCPALSPHQGHFFPKGQAILCEAWLQESSFQESSFQESSFQESSFVAWLIPDFEGIRLFDSFQHLGDQSVAQPHF